MKVFTLSEAVAKCAAMDGGVPGNKVVWVPKDPSATALRTEPRDQKGYDVSKGESAPNDGLGQNVQKLGVDAAKFASDIKLAE